MLESLAPHLLKVGPIELDIVTRVVRSPLGPAHLTPKQCHLLAIFMQRPNQVISREDLMREIWDTHYLGDTRTLGRSHSLAAGESRGRPDETRPPLVTVRKIGYKLVAGSSPAAPAEDEALVAAEG